LKKAIPYQPAWRLARSLELVSTSWFHDGRFGTQRVEELIAPYAAFLASYGVLGDQDVWKDATTNEFLGSGPA
jgi:NitT/TauT family transport system substrate-binding protein